ncbi:COX15/CtaA family protein [Aestuariivita sp.]|jgi:cytochrome c oxidase assembly protein subunit 15|uniref:COX15/CtaA family protein n=1 Tax=Aestuariivita sp. TaxID=1872407 RepID=UPI0021727E0F|nr:COX15/CtaA family protein [Aestuariivita sp.]MCE8005734.1 heme A synthase [Aestuariivita sp.]
MSSKRNIFEEVSEPTRKSRVKPGLIDRGRGGARGAIRAWLMALFTLVVAMIAVGGLTRLTDSGLSITEWRPLTGAIPPLSAQDWAREFALYQQIDEWRIQNQWMTLEDFKVIYWWEWGHRQLGRLVGLVWAIGFFGFLIARRIPSGRDGLRPLMVAIAASTVTIAAEVARMRGLLADDPAQVIELAGLSVFIASLIWFMVHKSPGWAARLLFLGLLGGLQGAIGWWMVASGVTSGESVVDVASYRLATHLGLAFVILGFIAWYIFLLGRPERDLMQARRAKEAKSFSMATGLMHFAFLQILIGALVAGIDAGRSYTDWPLMGGAIFPQSALVLEPLWRNVFESPGLVQFIHRVAGYLLLVFGIIVWLRGRRSAHPRTRFAFDAVMCALALQIVLGIVTVLYAAPWQIAILHQLLAVLLWVLILRARFLSAYPIATSIKDA